MMSTVGEVVDEGLGEEFEDTPWVPPTIKRVGDDLAWRWFGFAPSRSCSGLKYFEKLCDVGVNCQQSVCRRSHDQATYASTYVYTACYVLLQHYCSHPRAT